ncbi:AAA domain-containing protein [Luteimonas viscosa]|uniref:AAA domain-containing protein n=1 Tax=Luteimonas viscosa TaxID=1132694 RepID=A0A5D4XFX6_9GAMM|nr:AAA family ATPase [Luteimonas viscosa]TYT23576.1 AAA domain-containing protein [Luteimonas viscosa]
MEFLLFAAGVVAGALAMSVWSRRARRMAAPTRAAEAAPGGAVAADPAPTDVAAEDRLQALKQAIEANDDAIQRPADLLQQPGFEEGVALLAGPAFGASRVLECLTSQGYVLPSLAGAALRRREDIDPHAVAATIPQLGAYALHFVLDYLQTLPDAGTLPEVAMAAREWWWDYGGIREDIRRYLRRVSALPAGDATPTAPADAEESRLEEISTTLGRFREPVLQPSIDAVAAALAGLRERRVLGGIGRLDARAAPAPRFWHDALRDAIDELHERLTGPSPRPQLLVGEPGIGKSVLLDLLCTRLHDEGWLVFEASAADVLAGQKYIGELEGRLREMLAVLQRQRALWRVPDFFDLLHKGSHSNDPRGILDLVLPAVERGELLLIGELTPQQQARLLLSRPAVARLFDVQPMAPASEAALADIAGQWAQAARASCGQDAIEAGTLAEALRVAAQYFPDQHEPGRSLRLLDDALALARQQQPPALPIDGNTLLLAVGQRSGLPMEVIDQRQRLSLDGLRDVFRRRVVGQDEAVECLVDRIAMLKAGLTDSRRPIGVFLFAGPTGTGKTELAKTLGELLFGSDERLLRLDMSEFQSPDSAHRLIAGGRGDDGARSLVSRIREQPFSVVLLDEFEKAHPNVWDLFLQVFDDGRLSDQHGNTADFRHSIIILTSNVGSTIARGAGPGFTASAGGYSRGTVEKALYETFRREFLNRLDRVVLFRPLDRAAMRGILHKELARALERRGLRSRDWAVEWEPSAVEFLLDRGFTPDLGARPLRRAIEDHLLAPLARSIVEHRAPEGGQFLFVRGAGDRLDVEFIDPDAPAAGVATAAAASDLRALVDAAQDAALPAATLEPHLLALSARVEDGSWNEARDADFGAMNDAGFWTDPGRFPILDRIERRDRIESALAGAARMLDRLRRGADRTLPARLAQLLFLLEIAIDDLVQGRPQDAELVLSAGDAELSRHAADVRTWWQRLLGMYLAWGERRGMQVEVLEQDPQRCRARLSVSGFGAFHLLAAEAGLHVLEIDDERGATERLSIQVAVTPAGPGGADPAPAPSSAPAAPPICRRYRGEPAPLVRDTRRGWRSGRLDRVLAGDFDLIH